METTPKPPGECVLAPKGYVERSGYAKYKNDAPQARKWGTRYAHRIAYAEHHGRLPAGQLDHLCHSADLSCPGGPKCPHRRCINALHLEDVTAVENVCRRRYRSGTGKVCTLAPDDPRHGSLTGYTGRGCRCDRCRQAMTDYAREYQRRRKMRERCARDK